METGSVKKEIESLKEHTLAFFKSFDLDTPNLDYINEKYLTDRKKAVRLARKPAVLGKAEVDPKELEKLSKIILPEDQASMYVFNISDDGTTTTFYTSCGVDGVLPSSIADTQIVSLTDIGICYQYTLYNMVYND